MSYAVVEQEVIGYAHPCYAASLQEYGEPVELSRSGGWLLIRAIPGSTGRDAAGCYPFFACRDWGGLPEDLEQATDDLVSLGLVVDPLAPVERRFLERCFDIVRPFKTHYVADLRHPVGTIMSREVRYKARKALKSMEIEVTGAPERYLDEWVRLYDNLILRHHVTGMSAFSRQSFELQLSLPGMQMVLARSGEEVIGAALVLTQGERAYSHLSAYSDTGYRLRASYAIYERIITHFAEQGIRFVDLGGSAGLGDDPQDGLAQFKKCWSNSWRTAFFCGSVFDREAYDALCNRSGTIDDRYFPAYRSPRGNAVGGGKS